jgi:hypothetical protein
MIRCAPALLLAFAIPASAQKTKAWTPSRTPDGQPDLQGMWTNGTITPLERTAEFAGKTTLTELEAAAFEKRIAEERSRPPKAGEVTETWLEPGTKVLSSRQTSLVIDPPDGRIPLTAAAEAKRDDNFAHSSDSYERMGPRERCITRGMPAEMFPAGHSNAYQIVQTPGYFMLLSELIHEAHIIPLDGSPHLPQSVRQWTGDSRGHWEGNTLVVDTTNFNGKGWIATGLTAGRIRGIMQSQRLHVVERFTRTSPDTILYEVTVDDPEVYTRPWTVSMPLTRDDSYVMYEYACHEGNQAVELTLRGGRAHDH